MIFILKERTFAAALEGTGDLSTALIAICHHGVMSRHVVAPDPGIDAGAGESSCGRWLRQPSLRVRASVLGALRVGQERMGRMPRRRPWVQVVPSGTDYASDPPALTPDEALTVANLPLNVWLETTSPTRFSPLHPESTDGEAR